MCGTECRYSRGSRAPSVLQNEQPQTLTIGFFRLHTRHIICAFTESNSVLNFGNSNAPHLLCAPSTSTSWTTQLFMRDANCQESQLLRDGPLALVSQVGRDRSSVPRCLDPHLEYPIYQTYHGRFSHWNWAGSRKSSRHGVFGMCQPAREFELDESVALLELVEFSGVRLQNNPSPLFTPHCTARRPSANRGLDALIPTAPPLFGSATWAEELLSWPSSVAMSRARDPQLSVLVPSEMWNQGLALSAMAGGSLLRTWDCPDSEALLLTVCPKLIP